MPAPTSKLRTNSRCLCTLGYRAACSALTTAGWPFSAARSAGVKPSLDTTVRAAPQSSSTCSQKRNAEGRHCVCVRRNATAARVRADSTTTLRYRLLAFMCVTGKLYLDARQVTRAGGEVQRGVELLVHVKWTGPSYERMPHARHVPTAGGVVQLHAGLHPTRQSKDGEHSTLRVRPKRSNFNPRATCCARALSFTKKWFGNTEPNEPQDHGCTRPQMRSDTNKHQFVRPPLFRSLAPGAALIVLPAFWKRM